jgi:hypothetical protein
MCYKKGIIIPHQYNHIDKGFPPQSREDAKKAIARQASLLCAFAVKTRFMILHRSLPPPPIPDTL